MSISSVRLLFIPQNAAKLTANAVLPTPPFKLTQDRTIGGMTGSFQSFGKTAVFLKKKQLLRNLLFDNQLCQSVYASEPSNTNPSLVCMPFIFADSETLTIPCRFR